MRVATTAIVLLLTVACSTTPSYVHEVSEGGDWAHAPVVPEAMAERVVDAAADYEAQGIVSRIAFYDIAFPASVEEFSATNGHAVLLLTAVSQDRTELPPARVYVTISDQTHELRAISAVDPQPVTDPRVRRVLGPHRWDALYIFPVALARNGAVVTLDFAANRDGFVFGELQDVGVEDLGYDPNAIDLDLGGGVPMDAITTIVEREFPGFLVVGH